MRSPCAGSPHPPYPGPGEILLVRPDPAREAVPSNEEVVEFGDAGSIIALVEAIGA
jgi:hypothetical protein